MYQTITDSLVIATLVGINVLFLAIFHKLSTLTANVMTMARAHPAEPDAETISREDHYAALRERIAGK